MNAIGILAVCALAWQAPGPSVPEGRELFVDPSFERGLTLTAEKHPAPKIEIGTLQVGETSPAEPPAWRLAQWGTRFVLQPGRCTPLGDDAWFAENAGKRIVIDRTDGAPTHVLLEARGIAEYDGHLRALGEAWPHALIEQAFPEPLRADRLTRLSFRADMRVVHCRPDPRAADRLDPGLHTAQVSAFWTVHNLTPDSPDHKDMIWLGIPFFDARHDVPPGHFAIDIGKSDASGKFICNFEGKRFWTGPTGDGNWRSLDADLLALLREGLAISQKHGHLKDTRFEDLGITSFNLGWEIPGPYDAAIELRGLSMTGQDK